MRIEHEARTKPTGDDVDKQLSRDSEDKALEDKFFSEPPMAEPVDTFWDLDAESDDEDDVARVRSSRRAMIVTFVILGIAVVGIGSYTVYAKVIMPTPVAMGAVTSLPELPQPIYSDSQKKKGRVHNSIPAKKPIQAQSTEPAKQETAAPLSAELASTLPIETGATAQEQQVAELEQSSQEQQVAEQEQSPAAENQAEPTEDKNTTLATTEPPPEESKRAETEKALAQAEEPALAQAEATEAVSKAVYRPVQPAAESVRQRVKRRRAAVRIASSAKPPSEYKAIVKRAKTLYRSRKTRDRAVAEYKRALTLKPNGGEALRQLSYYYLNQGKSGDAEQFADRAVRTNGNNAQNWFLLGAARDARNNRQGALQAYRNCAQGKGAYAERCKALIR